MCNRSRLLLPSIAGAIPCTYTLIKFFRYFIPSGPPSAPTLSCVDLSKDVSGTVNVTVSWTLSGGDSADFYLINITTNAPQTPYGGLLNITTVSVTQHKLTGFLTGYEYNITIHGVNCQSLVGSESKPLKFRPQGSTRVKTTTTTSICREMFTNKVKMLQITKMKAIKYKAPSLHLSLSFVLEIFQSFHKVISSDCYSVCAVVKISNTPGSASH